MKNIYSLITICCALHFMNAQVGINNTNPQAQLDITASSTSTPTNEDGILIPRIDNFPATNPTATQDGMMVFATGNGTPSKGFYYWDNTITNWIAIGGSANDADWYVANTTNTSTSITDNLITQGSVTVGNSVIGGSAKLNVYSNDSNSTSLRIDNSGTIGLENQGILITNNSLNGTASERFVGNFTSLTSNDGYSQTGFKAGFSNLASGSFNYGLINDFQAGGTNGYQRGVRNYFGGGEIGIGVENLFPGAFTYSGTIYGVNNSLQAQGNGTRYGVYNNISGTGTGTKYGVYTNISSTSAGMHFGMYSDVQNTSGYAGYFVGRTSFGNTTTNRYILPASDGTAGQIMTTDGAGNISFTSPTTSGGTLDQAYDFGGAGLGRTIIADNGAVDIQDIGGLRVEGDISAASNIVHDADTDTNLSFTLDRIKVDAGGINYIDIQQSDAEITFNEDSTANDFRVESDNQDHMLFIDGSNDAIGIGQNNPVSPLHVGITTPFDLSYSNTGQDGLFLIGGGDNSGLNAIGSSIGFGPPATVRADQRKAAIASVQTSADVDHLGLAFYVHGNSINQSDMTEGMRLTHSKNLGINNTSPDANLDVIGTMQYVDGNENTGYVLTSDANGNATWADPNTLITSSSDWTTTGNTGTDPSINFIGTTDAQDLSIRTNNTEKVRITTKGQIETTQLQSVWIGENAGDAVTTGSRNVFIGRLSGQLTTTGLDNTAIGGLTLSNITTSADNTAVGLAALFDLTSGDGNTVIGEQAAENLTTGSNNVIIGHLAGENMSGSGNIFIGTSAGQSLTADNRLIIDNANDGISSFIYGEMDNEILRANAQVEITRDSNGTTSHLELNETAANDGARIRFKNSVETANEWVLYGRADDTPGNGSFNIYSSEISSNVIRVESDGKVGIMRNPTTNVLEVGGDASKTTAGSWLANSDRRLKKDINQISGKTAIEKIKNMRGVTYFWNDDKTGINRPKDIQYGFIAQELMETFPEKVSKDNLGYYQTAYGDYDAIFVEAIKTLNDEIETLKEENNALKKALEKQKELEKRLEALENNMLETK